MPDKNTIDGIFDRWEKACKERSAELERFTHVMVKALNDRFGENMFKYEAIGPYENYYAVCMSEKLWYSEEMTEVINEWYETMMKSDRYICCGIILGNFRELIDRASKSEKEAKWA